MGYFLNKDGSTSATKASNSVALICYVGKIQNYCDEFLALAVSDAWDPSSSPTWPNAMSAVQTYANNNKVTLNGVEYSGSSNFTTSMYDVVTSNASASTQVTPSVSIRKGWRMPSVTDWKLVFDGVERFSPGYGKAYNTNGIVHQATFGLGQSTCQAINKKIHGSATGSGANYLGNGNQAYWVNSGSTYSSRAWYYYFRDTSKYWYDSNTSTDRNQVRAVFAY